MANSNFQFLHKEFPILFNIGQAAEFHLHTDAITTLFKLRQWGEKLCEFMFQEHNLEFPADNSFHVRLKTLEYEKILPDAVKDLLHTIKHKGNGAVHDNKGTTEDAKGMLFAAFKVAKWFYQTYAVSVTDLSDVKFHVPEKVDTGATLEALEKQYKELEQKFDALLKERDTNGLPVEKQNQIKERSARAASKIEMSEAETRELIDEQLQVAGWEADTKQLNFKHHKTLPQRGRNMAIAEWPAGGKWADYALFIGTELYAIVEAKKWASDISGDLQQAKTYAQLVTTDKAASLLGEWESYRVPFLFSTNGRPYLEQIKTKSGIWFLDVRDAYNHARPLQGWYSPEGLKKLWQQDTPAAVEKLKAEPLDFLESPSGLGLRKYQINAIRAVEQTLTETPEQRRMLLAMATGTGKTRTIIGLCYRLIQSNRFRRILFLVDRRMLAEQAIGNFTDNKVVDLNTFKDIYDIKGLAHQVPDIDTRLHFATVQSMVKRLFYADDDKPGDIPSVDWYDCIIIDEAHRGYLLDREVDEDDLSFKDQNDYVSMYRRVLDYFDAVSIGLTATPALQTTRIFGKAIYTYSYREAVIDGFLIDHEPPFIIKTHLSEQGIVWEKGDKPKVLDKENNLIEELGELDDELKIEIAGFNRQVITENFNRTVIQQLVQEIDPEGDEKTLVFAASDEHADMVVRLFKEEFDNIGIDVPDSAVKKITGKVYDPSSDLIHFKNEKFPNIVVTVDLLTTGIDVPQICNLVFLRRVKSRILYEQMIGRATRRCDNIGKEIFRIYDAVRLYETLQDYTQMKPVVVNPTATFGQLADELAQIDNAERARRQIEQLVAKMRRKQKLLVNGQADRFTYFASGTTADELIDELLNQPTAQTVQRIAKLPGLWKYLDELKPEPTLPLVSDHADHYVGTERGYGKGQKPEDYLQSFSQFIAENQNKITALQIVCTRPAELSRQSLRELMMELDHRGFTTRSLQAAWKDAKNEAIAADIISYIRTLAVGSSLVSHDERIRRAVSNIRNQKVWNKVQLKWIDRFEKQLIQESILQHDDLDTDPLFANEGGFARINKVFDNQLDELLGRMNESLYIA